MASHARVALLEGVRLHLVGELVETRGVDSRAPSQRPRREDERRTVGSGRHGAKGGTKGGIRMCAP
jgi:hypothetical protein